MESSTPARVLVVAHRTAATPGLADAVRRRAAEGPAIFTLARPAHRARPAPPDGPRGRRRRRGARDPRPRAPGPHAPPPGRPVEGMVGDPAPLTAIEDAVNAQPSTRSSSRPCPTASRAGCASICPAKARGLGLAGDRDHAGGRGARDELGGVGVAERPEVGLRQARGDRLGLRARGAEASSRDRDQPHAVGRDDLVLRREPVGGEAEVGDGTG